MSSISIRPPVTIIWRTITKVVNVDISAGRSFVEKRDNVALSLGGAIAITLMNAVPGMRVVKTYLSMAGHDV
jgi:hypothetical protein